MSDAATRERAIRQHWAEPGSRHDRLVRVAKLALPVGALGRCSRCLRSRRSTSAATSASSSTRTRSTRRQERMRVEAARYTGEDNLGPAVLDQSPSRAIQPQQRPADRRDRGDGGAARPARRPARHRRQQRPLRSRPPEGPHRRTGPRRGPERLSAGDPRCHHRFEDRASSPATARSAARCGSARFTAGHLSADLGDRTVALTGGARLKIVQGAVR